MAERVVSVKLPRSLLRELHALREAHHYLDLSEQLRSIVRARGLALMGAPAQDASRGTLEKHAREQVLGELIRMLKEDKR